MASPPRGSSPSARKPSTSPSRKSRSRSRSASKSRTSKVTSKFKRFAQNLTGGPSSSSHSLQQEVPRLSAKQRIQAVISSRHAKLKTQATKMNAPPPAQMDGRPEKKVVIDLTSEDEEEGEEEDEEEDEEDFYDLDSPGPSPLAFRGNQNMNSNLPASFPPQRNSVQHEHNPNATRYRPQFFEHEPNPYLFPPPPPPIEHEANPYLAPVVHQPAPAPQQQNGQGFNPNAFWGDYLLDDLDDDAVLQEIINQGNALQSGQEPPLLQQFAPPAAPAPLNQNDVVDEELLDECVAIVSTLLPGICPEYVSDLYDKISKSSDRLIQHILDKVEKGTPYPKSKDQEKTLKRKRIVDEDEELIKKYGAVDRIIPAENIGTRSFIGKILGFEFMHTPMNFVNATLDGTGHRLFPAYRVLEEAERTFNLQNPPYQKIKTARKTDRKFRDVEKLMSELERTGEIDKIEVLKELQASRKLRDKAEAKRQAERDAELAEQANTARAEAEGTMGECGCCFCDYPLNRMVHCDGDPLHWFCRGCARRNAEEEIGKSKYELVCMSTDKCAAGFMADQRAQFLDESTKVALERNETEANLRLAGIENLASCPFCPFAAEYPPVEIDHEFRCQAPECEKVSCRLCKLESHIPKSCEEHAKENGLSIRRQIEEAMSAALIRKCNKCSTPFVKEEGCNKMTCTRNGCYNIQCYVCSKSCNYDHFDDAARGGKRGNCPLFESVEERHQGEVSKAEKEAMEKVLADHPEYSEDDLKVKMSENVAKDDNARKAKDPRNRLEIMRGGNILGRLPGGLHGVLPGGLHRARRFHELDHQRFNLAEVPQHIPQMGAVPEEMPLGKQNQLVASLSRNLRQFFKPESVQPQQPTQSARNAHIKQGACPERDANLEVMQAPSHDVNQFDHAKHAARQRRLALLYPNEGREDCLTNFLNPLPRAIQAEASIPQLLNPRSPKIKADISYPPPYQRRSIFLPAVGLSAMEPEWPSNLQVNAANARNEHDLVGLHKVMQAPDDFLHATNLDFRRRFPLYENHRPQPDRLNASHHQLGEEIANPTNTAAHDRTRSEKLEDKVEEGSQQRVWPGVTDYQLSGESDRGRDAIARVRTEEWLAHQRPIAQQQMALGEGAFMDLLEAQEQRRPKLDRLEEKGLNEGKPLKDCLDENE